MNRTKYLQGICVHCGGTLQFLADQIGLNAPCPHCGQQTELLLAPPEADTSGSRRMIIWSIIGILIVALGLGVPLIGLKYFQGKLDAKRQARQPAAAVSTNGAAKAP